MGIDAPTARYLMICRAAGMHFGKVLTLGRQSLHFDSVHLSDCARDLNLKWTEADIHAVFSDPGRKCEPFFHLLGAETVESLDASDYEGATFLADLNQPLGSDDQLAPDKPLHNHYDFVFDGGTLEHVFHFPNAIENVMRLLAPGANFLSVTVANNFLGHGFYQFSPETFFRVFCEVNGFECVSGYLYEESRPPSFRWMRIKDPAIAQSRVLLRNTRQTYIAFHARKVGKFEGFRAWPQQSDYSALWREQGATVIGGTAAVSGLKATRRRLKALSRLLMRPIRDPIRGFRLALGSGAYDRRHYTPVQLDLALASELERRLRHTCERNRT